MLWIFDGSSYFSQTLRSLFEFLVRFTIQCSGKGKFTRSLLLLAQGLVNPGQLVVNRSIVIGGYGDLEVFFRLPVVAEFGVCGA